MRVREKTMVSSVELWHTNIRGDYRNIPPRLSLNISAFLTAFTINRAFG